MEIVIDNRENKLIPIVQKLLQSQPTKFESISLSIQQLNVSDIQIKNKNNETLLMIERKSVSDLAASISDGRYNEQSYRLNSLNIPNHNIYYLIEGNIKSFKGFNQRINSNTLYSSLFTLSYFKGFSIYKTDDINETANFIVRITDKLYRENKSNTKNPYYQLTNELALKNPNLELNSDYASVLKPEKKSFINKNNIAKIMLMQIPNVSHTAASIITEKYKTIIDLIVALQENEDCLNNLTYITKNGKDRKVNKTCIQNIKDFLLNED